MDIVGSIYFPKDCHLSPHLFTAGLTRLVQQAGGQFSWNTEVRGWRKGSKGIEAVETNRGALQADDYVIAGGSWSPEIARGLDLKLPMQPGKGYSVTLSIPRRLPAICSILTEARVAVTPMGSTLRFGGTMEMAGMDDSINPVRVQGIIKSAVKYFPELRLEDFNNLPAWRGFRPCSPDGLPYLGRFPQYSNLLAATGHSMMGLSLGPITGKLMAQIVSNERPAVDIQLLEPGRYS
jgi:D-amino-acid dehydrogenase